MKQVGARRGQQLVEQASGALLAEGARFNEAVAGLSQAAFMPKGVYRFRSHEEANRHQQSCLALGMARLAARRAKPHE